MVILTRDDYVVFIVSYRGHRDTTLAKTRRTNVYDASDGNTIRRGRFLNERQNGKSGWKNPIPVRGRAHENPHDRSVTVTSRRSVTSCAVINMPTDLHDRKGHHRLTVLCVIHTTF